MVSTPIDWWKAKLAADFDIELVVGDFEKAGQWRGDDKIYINPDKATDFTILHEVGHVLCGHMCCREHCEYAAHGAALALAHRYGLLVREADHDRISAYAGRTADAACPCVQQNGGRPTPQNDDIL